MSMTHLGPSFDIHTGGVDLIFPHHEDEIAQSEAATGLPFVTTWLHCAHLRMGGAKMAKSAGNIARVGDLIDAGRRAAGPALCADLGPLPGGAQLRGRVALAAAAALDRLDAVSRRWTAYREDAPDDPGCPRLLEADGTAFEAALDDDLNVSAGWPRCSTWVRELNRRIDARTLSTATPPGGRPAPRARPVLGVRRAAGRASTRSCRRCWTPGSPPGRRATGPRRTGSATSWRPAGSASRTRATGSAGALVEATGG